MALPIQPELVAAYKANVDEANAVAKRVKAATTDVEENVTTFLAESTDDQIVKFREWYSATEAKMKEIEATLKEKLDEAKEFARGKVAGEIDIDVEAEKAKYLELRKQVTTMRKGFETFYSQEVIDEALADVDEVIGFKGTSTGTGAPKPRLSEVSVNGENLDKATFTNVSQYLAKNFKVKFSGSDLGKMAAEQNNVSSVSELESGSFQITAGDSQVTINFVTKQKSEDSE